MTDKPKPTERISVGRREVIHVEWLAGSGVTGDPYRTCSAYFTMDGDRIAAHDPCEEPEVTSADEARRIARRNLGLAAAARRPGPKPSEDDFIAGFVCAGGDVEEARRQAPQYVSCVLAGQEDSSNG